MDLKSLIHRNRLAVGVLLSTVLVWSLLAVHSLSSGFVTWDELFDFEGVNGAFWHGINVLKGARPDLHTITFDLEYFGNATRWPTYLLWRLLMTLPWESITTLSRTQIVLTSSYVGLNHLNAMVFALVGIGLTAALAWRLGERFAGSLAAALLLLLPTWLGHGWMNSKDIPMATSYLLYTLGTTLLLQRQRGGAPLRVVGIGLMAGSRVGSLAFIALGEALLSPWLRRSPPARWLGSLGGGLLLGFLLTPQAWGDPFGYPLEAMRFIGDRQVSGDPIGTLRYVLENLFDLLPSPLILGLLLLLLTLPRGGAAVRTVAVGERSLPAIPLLLPTLLQLLIPPTLLIVAGRSVYNELRHLLMIQPPLCVLGGLGYARALGTLRRGLQEGRGPAAARVPRALLRSLLLLAAGATLVLGLELLLLSPYQYTYRSDLARLLDAGHGSPLRSDYWGFSGRETLSRCLKNKPCADLFSRLPLQVDNRSFNPDLIEASTTLLRPAPLPGPEGTLLISTDPLRLARNEALVATLRLTLLPRPHQVPLSAIALEASAGQAP